MTKRLSVIAAVVGALGLVVAFVLWRVPAEEFILAPDRAKPLAGKVEVENARPSEDQSVYYVDVFVRRTSLLEQLLPFTKPDGSTVLPERALLPPGTSEAERDRQNEADMERSEKVAAVVALRALTPAFYARGDTATPVKVLAVSILVNIALKVALMGSMAHAGLALATSVGAWVNAVLLAWILMRRGMLVPDSRLIRLTLVAAAGSFALAAVVTALQPYVGRLTGLVPALPDLAPTGALLLAGGLVYLAVLFLGLRVIRRV